MKRVLSVLLASLLLLCCTAPAVAEAPIMPGSETLQIFDNLLQGTWTMIDKGSRPSKLPVTFTYGEDEGYYLFITADNRVYLAWSDPDSGLLIYNQHAEVAFSADGQYLLLIQYDSAYVYVRQ